MHIIDHKSFSMKQKTPKKRRRLFASLVILLIFGVIVLSSYVAIRYAMPLPEIRPEINEIQVSNQQQQLAWPQYGQAAVGELQSGVLASTGSDLSQPTASVAKVMTALAIIRHRPISKGQQGPLITMQASDEALYNSYVAKNGSVTRVTQGGTLSQYQALQSILLASSNNMAETTARWAFGDSQEYNKFANSLAVSLNMKHTTITDASGFSPLTVSTAKDLVLLGIAALKEPVLAEIMKQSSANIPMHGEIENVNYLLGREGIIGIKTGNTDEAGGCYLVASERILENGEKKIIIASILGAPSRTIAIEDTRPLLRTAEANYKPIEIVKANQTVGSYRVPWSSTIEAVSKQSYQVYVWSGSTVRARIILNTLPIPVNDDQTVGSITVNGYDKKVAVVARNGASQPSVRWKLQRAAHL